MHARTMILGAAITAATAALLAAQPRAADTSPVASLAAVPVRLAEQPPAPRFATDPADSLYRAGRDAMARNDYGRAAEIFRQLGERFPESRYAPDALYWQAYALFRQGGSDELRQARHALDLQAERFPEVAARGDAPALRARVNGALARGGDPDAAVAVWRAADAGAAAGAAGAAGAEAARAAAGSGERTDAPAGAQCPAERDDERIVALNALLQMDSDRALPILERVIARRDECSAALRRRAMFLVAQKEGPRREEILLEAIRNDPDGRVREQAVFWLSETKSERATGILEELLRTSTDDRVRDKAIFALANQRSPRASQILREFAERSGGPRKLRERAIFWIGQEGTAEDAAWLRQLYGRLDDAELKERVLFSLAQKKGQGNEEWLLGVARDERETPELRGKAIFWLGQGQLVSTADLGTLYGQLDEREVKEQLIFALSQRPDRASVDRLMDIARNDGDRRLRERAVFWLSQSKDPRVVDFLMEIIDR